MCYALINTIYGAITCFGLSCLSFVAVFRAVEAVSEISGRKCVAELRVWYVNLVYDYTSCVVAQHSHKKSRIISDVMVLTLSRCVSKLGGRMLYELNTSRTLFEEFHYLQF